MDHRDRAAGGDRARAGACTPRFPDAGRVRLALMVGAPGVRFGDIGTSPIYTLRNQRGAVLDHALRRYTDAVICRPHFRIDVPTDPRARSAGARCRGAPSRHG